MVFDFGGGTLDIVVIEVDETDVNVVATRGNNHLGGRDIDYQLQKSIIKLLSLKGH